MNECPQWIYKEYPVRIQFFIDLTLTTEKICQLGNKLMKIIRQNLQKKGFSIGKSFLYLKNDFLLDYNGCHTFIDERNIMLHQFYYRLGFVDIPIMDGNDYFILLGKQF